MTNYKELYTQLHYEDPDFGTSGTLIDTKLTKCIGYLKPKSILDYGCGKGTLIKQLKEQYPDIEILGYDPYVSEYSSVIDRKVDLVVNTDVIEHIPENNVCSIIEQISKISDNCFFQFHHYPAVAILPNGENAHCTIKPISWYTNILNKYFKDILVFPGATELQSIVTTFKIPQDLCKDFLKDKNDDISYINRKIQKEYITKKTTFYRMVRRFSKKYNDKYNFYSSLLNKI